ncbi:BMP family ABC transporter substrate-binding protein [Herbiconiux moechotypicola]|uniref:BMP family ABC transporter substrate-binding protein n=1 Tax=Herbiconiux moechotypicola TaxID=637393 RepID=A0ABP5Q8I0_9MICO|nr:BMP family ABC transporter substrate-binding protein [Herbiconiux moechotypicola]MCS5729292.1 BMP family ABC transporter substrate-binding protein [Herbiconiux moechotypicola]
MRNHVSYGAAALALAAAGIVLAGCATPPSEASGSGAAAASDVLACMDSGESGIKDKSFNESSWNGFTKAESELGVEVKVAESKDTSQYLPNLQSLVRQDCDIIATMGYDMQDITVQEATANPDTHFMTIDDQPPGDLPNVKPILFNTADASYLAGYLAAGMTTTGKVGTYGGQLIPTVTLFMDGFADGVAKYNDDNATSVEVVGWDKAAQNGSATGDWNDTNLAKQLSSRMIDQGVDIIMPVAGGAGTGTLAAIRDANAAGKDVKAIWVDTDGYETVPEYKDLFLTSVMKRIDSGVFSVIQEQQDGGFSSDPYVGTLANDGVGLAPFHDFESAIPTDLQATLDELATQISDGTIVIDSPSIPKA